MQASILKPGLLVSLHTAMRGGVSYSRIDQEKDHTTEDGARRARWETIRTIPDPDEFERATKARSKARAAVSGVCVQSAFGLLCPEDKEQELDLAIKQARAIADGFNATAALSRVQVYVLVGRVARDDEEAARAIASEVRGLMESMQAAIKAADVDAIRESASKARQLGGMLSTDVAVKVADAVAQARKVAKEIVAQVGRGAETAAQVVARMNVKAIEEARFAFLDLDEQGSAQAIELAPRAVDIDPSAPPSEVKAYPSAGPARAFELEAQ